jgi:hypothetical protein
VHQISKHMSYTALCIDIRSRLNKGFDCSRLHGAGSHHEGRLTQLHKTEDKVTCTHLTVG